MQGYILTATEKCTLVVDSTLILIKLMEHEMKVKGTAAVKCTFFLKLK